MEKGVANLMAKQTKTRNKCEDERGNNLDKCGTGVHITYLPCSKPVSLISRALGWRLPILSMGYMHILRARLG